ncbi:Protein NRT1/ PTR FAMILY 7.1, partial [Bienertia sinuspersici]
GVNLVLFLTRVLRQDNAVAANNVSVWTGTVYMFSLVGAFLSDSYWGRFLTCCVFQLILLLGLVLLSLSSWLFLLKPKGCGTSKFECHETSTVGEIIFYISIYMVALGYGGHQPTCATFGADQFDDSTQKGQISRATFFAYFYFALNCGSLFSNTVLVYYEDNGSWTFGFWLSTGAAFLGLVLYVSGSPGYRFIKAHGNPLPRVAQVFVAAYRKWNVEVPSPSELYEMEATLTRKDMREPKNPWQICTVTQVEEAKCVLKLLPLWLCTIIYSVIFTQMASLFVEQGDVMDTKVGKFNLPAASMSVFNICSVLISTGIYRHILVPVLGRMTGNPKGLSELQRMGVGLIIGMLAMVAAGVTEIERLKRVVPHERHSSLSVLWQIPQYVLVGASEVFMYVGQLEFFNGQAPDGIKSFGSSLCMASMSFGNYVSSLLVHMVMLITARGDNPGWIPANLNHGHIERFYFLIMALAGIDVVIYLIFARWYKPVTFVETSHRPDQVETNYCGETNEDGGNKRV